MKSFKRNPSRPETLLLGVGSLQWNLCLETSSPSASKEGKHLIDTRTTKCHGRERHAQSSCLAWARVQLRHGDSKRCAKLWVSLVCDVSRNTLSHSEGGLAAHVYRREHNNQGKQDQYPPETVRNASSQVHTRPTKAETLGVAQESVFSQVLQEFLAHSQVWEPPYRMN